MIAFLFEISTCEIQAWTKTNYAYKFFYKKQFIISVYQYTYSLLAVGGSNSEGE
jgi:hypothetical protein